MAELVKEAEDEIRVMISSHHFIFEPMETTWVDADRDKIGQVINNLLSNAIKYSPLESTIHVSCITERGCVRVSVGDEGMGVQPQDVKKLFDRFYRVQGEPTKAIAGFGIGLYLCKEIVDRHKGSIGVESEPGKGSTFWFTLPVATEQKIDHK